MPSAPTNAVLARRFWRWMPWAVSIGLHAALIAAGFFIVWRVAGPAGEARPTVFVSFDEPAPVRLAADPPPMSFDKPADQPPASPLLPSLPPLPIQPLADAPAISEPLRASSSLPDRGPTTPPRVVPTVRFAGLGASNARSIIYVVDASGSMISSFPIVLGHLERSVRKLAPTQRFQIIFFQRDGLLAAPHPEDDRAIPKARLIRASRQHIEDVLEWSRAVRPSGRSNPIPALQAALALRPDAVFVLSTTITGAGLWEPDREALLAELDALNPADPLTGKRPAVIKTIQFLDDDPAGILRAIAEAHGGAEGFRFITPKEITTP